MSIETLLSDLPPDWYLYSLRFCPGDRPPAFRWEATLRNATVPLVTYGQGDSAALALALAADRIDYAEVGVCPTVSYTVTSPSRPSLSDLLAHRSPALRIDRRL
jgi:hypothetical protein